MKLLRIKEAAEFLGFSIKTLQKWDREGLLVPYRTKTNRRIYTEKQLLDFLNFKKKDKE